MNKQALVQMLDNKPELRHFLFIRGFMVTDNGEPEVSGFPFYGEWKQHFLAGYHFYCHPLTGFHYFEVNDSVFFLLGHAYNPFTMAFDESVILSRIGEAYGTNAFLDRVDEITGVFVFGAITNGKIEYIVDPSGMQSACSGIVNGHFYLSSHPQLVADICNLEIDSFVRELIGYKWYGRVMGPYLPADLTPFVPLKRVVPNISYTCSDGKISHFRFYPLKDITEVKDTEEYNAVITAAADILRNNMVLVSRKWQAPAVSLTGGIDSNTTFAAANGIYDRFTAFSYYSAPKEKPDADAAQKIATRFSVPWVLYNIPETAESLEDYEEKAAIIQHNNGYIAKAYDNELRKRVFLQQTLSGDVEVKSWVSETIRAYWYKHYGRKRFPKLSGKLFRNLYKIFLLNRKLAHNIDKLFSAYIDEYEYAKIPAQYPPADMHFNEVTWGSWGGLNISEMKFYSDITFIYNNRRFLDLLFRIPLDKRISDQHHLDMKKCLNPELYDMGIRVVNAKETNFRAFCLNLIFTVNSILPF